MNELYVKELFIVSPKDKKAKKVEFTEGINVITSANNHVGKSTITKSLYYSLGAEVFFGKLLEAKDLVHILKFQINKETYLLMRHKNNYLLKSSTGIKVARKSSELTDILEGIFGFNVFLEDKSQKFIKAPPVFYYLPYYIDQDMGWSIQSLSFDKLSQFDKSYRNDAYYYHLGIYDSSYGIKKIRSKTLTQNKKKLEDEKKNALSLLSYVENNLSSYDMNLNYEYLEIKKNEILRDYEKYAYDINNLRRKILSYKEEIKKIDNTLVNLDRTIGKIVKIKQKVDSEFNVVCPFCNNEYEITSKKLLKINYDIEDVVSSKLALLDIKNKAEVDLKAEQKKHKEFISKLEEMESEKIGVDFNLDDILKFKGLQRTKEDLTNQVGTIERNLDPIKDELKELKKDLKQWKELRSIADNDFKEKLVKNLLDFNVKELVIPDKGKIHMGSELDGSGSGQVRVNLARFYSMISLINEKNVNNKIVKFPFIIDSPKSGEQSIPNSKLIFDLLINKVKMTNQIILATIDFKDFYEDDMDKLNLIEINTPEFQLMSHEDYLKNKQYIEDLLEVYFESFTSN